MEKEILEKSGELIEKNGILLCEGMKSKISDFPEIIKTLKEINETTNLNFITGFLNEASLFIFEKIEEINNEQSNELFQSLLSIFPLISTISQVNFICEIVSEFSTRKSFIFQDLQTFLVNDESKNGMIKAFLLISLFDDLKIPFLEENADRFIPLIIEFFGLGTVSQRNIFLNLLLCFNITEERAAKFPIFELLWNHLFIVIDGSVDDYFSVTTIMKQIYDKSPFFYNAESALLHEMIETLQGEGTELDEKLDIIQKLIKALPFMSKDDLITTVKESIICFTDVSKEGNMISLDSLLALKEQDFINEQIECIWETVRPAIDKMEISSAALLFAASISNTLSTDERDVPTFLISRAVFLSGQEESYKPFISASIYVLAEHIEMITGKTDVTDNLIKSSVGDVMAFTFALKAIKKLLRDDIICTNDVYKQLMEIDINSLPNEITKKYFSTFQVMIQSSESSPCNTLNKFLINIVQNSEDTYKRACALRAVSEFADTEDQIFREDTMIGINAAHNIFGNEEATTETKVIASEFVQATVEYGTIKDYDEYIAKIFSQLLEISANAEEDIKQRRRALIICSNISAVSKLAVPIEIINSFIESDDVTLQNAAIETITTLFEYMPDDYTSKVLVYCASKFQETTSSIFMNSIFDFATEFIRRRHTIPAIIEKIITETALGRTRVLDGLHAYDYEGSCFSFYDLIIETFSQKSKKFFNMVTSFVHRASSFTLEKLMKAIKKGIEFCLFSTEELNKLLEMCKAQLINNIDEEEAIGSIIDVIDTIWETSGHSVNQNEILDTLYGLWNRRGKRQDEGDSYSESSDRNSECSEDSDAIKDSFPPLVFKLVAESPDSSIEFESIHTMLELVAEHEREWDYEEVLEYVMKLYSVHQSYPQLLVDIASVLAVFITADEDVLDDLGVSKKFIRDVEECFKSIITNSPKLKDTVLSFIPRDNLQRIVDVIKE